jgi:nitroreductase
MSTTKTRTATALTALDVIFTRRSVRSFRRQQLDRETITALIDAAVQAPTAMHVEPWAFAVVQNHAMLARYSRLAKQALLEQMAASTTIHAMADPSAAAAFRTQLASPEFDIFHHAPALIVICGRPAGSFVAADCWLAAENLMLAATAMGLGTCCIGSALPVLTQLDIRAELNIPAGYDVVAAIVVGIPADDATAAGAPRKPAEILSWS